MSCRSRNRPPFRFSPPDNRRAGKISVVSGTRFYADRAFRPDPNARLFLDDPFLDADNTPASDDRSRVFEVILVYSPDQNDDFSDLPEADRPDIPLNSVLSAGTTIKKYPDGWSICVDYFIAGTEPPQPHFYIDCQGEHYGEANDYREAVECVWRGRRNEWGVKMSLNGK